MADRGKYIEVLSKTVTAVKELNVDVPIKISLKSVEGILELLKEQEPVEPLVDVDTYVCPNCGHRLEHQGMLGDNVIFDERYNFCPACGKAVKWE